MNIQKLLDIVGGSLVRRGPDDEIREIITDSRRITAASPDALFLAIQGAHHDGHEFLVDLHKKGVRQFMMERDAKLDLLTDSNVVRVESTIDAFQRLVADHRNKYQIPVIGITGSNGKTIVKDWLHAMLSQAQRVLQSPKSYNSQLGVPLSVWQLNSTHETAIFEAGISMPDEMHKLEAIIKPTVGIFTNIGSAHDKGFQSRNQKIFEKLTLFSNAEVLIYCEDHHDIHNAIKQDDRIKARPLTWSFSQESDVRATLVNGQLQLKYADQIFNLKIPFDDQASCENLLHCLTYLLHLSYDEQALQHAIDVLQPVKMRLALKKGINNCYLVDDTYNNDLVGLEFALQFLNYQPKRDRKTVILSDIPQSALPASELYAKVNALLKAQKIDQLIGVGPQIESNQHLIDILGTYYASTDLFLQEFNPAQLSNELILVKGARAFRFERIVTRLAEKLHETVLEIDLDALTHNLNFYRNQLETSTKLMVMVKALAYGSGSAEVSNLLQFHKVDYLAVAYTDEGIELRKNGVQLPIMVMNPKDDLSQLVEYDLEPEVFSVSQLERYANELLPSNKQLGLHLNINTGMNRLGFDPPEIDSMISLIQESAALQVKSVFTHLAGADESMHEGYTLEQLTMFKPLAEGIEASLDYPIIKHALNSAGILNYPEYQIDMVRLGIGLHGFDPSGRNSDLLPVSTLKTVVSQVRQIKKGETVGYSRKGKAEQDMKVATIALGYADGFSRAFSNGVGQVRIKGQLAKVVGNVCMDMTMIDITGMDVHEGDEVIVFGKELPIDTVAATINTISYEILTNVSSRVKRIYFSS